MTTPPKIAPAMARRIELWPVERLVPYARNARTHSDEQVAQIAASIVEFGFNSPILVASDSGIVAGHGRLLAARKLGLAEVPVVVLDHLSETQRRAYLIADNKLSLNAGWDEELLAQELAELERDGLDLAVLGFGEDEVEALLAEVREARVEAETEEAIPEVPVQPVTRPGDMWLIGPHRLLCADCRESRAIARLFEGARANLVVTSPPYARQREYDPASGFRPVAPEEYVEWYRDVAAAIESVLAPDGSYLLNIKEHAEDGERSLYVKDLVIAHKRQWGWRFVDEFCWRKTDNGVPGGWSNRFKNAFELIFHFSRNRQIKFRPKAVGHVSDDCFDYSPDNPKSASGSGLLGTGARGKAAGKPSAAEDDGRRRGLARPSNVIEVKSESSQGAHSAPFPRALVEFFVEAFTDAGDVVFDPFMGSGTTMAAAAVLGRIGYGCEISPAYCDVIVRRIERAISQESAKGQERVPILAATGRTFEQVAAEREIDLNAPRICAGATGNPSGANPTACRATGRARPPAAHSKPFDTFRKEQCFMPEVATPNQAEREFETGTDESFKNTNATASAAHSENQRVTFANIKRTYDVYQDLDIQAARQALVEQTRLNQIASQALQNAVETANLVSKQAVRHGDIAIDGQWNPVQQGAGDTLTARAVSIDDVSLKAIGAVVAAAVADALSKKA